MNKYKIFRGFDEDAEVLSSRRLKKEDKGYYYDLIAEESDRGNKQLILTKDIILGVSLEYILKDKYDLIDMNTDSEELNEKIAKHIKRAKKDRGYLVAVILELNKDEYADINSITLQKYDEVISLYSNSIISTNTFLDEQLLNSIARNYCEYVS